MKQIILVFSLLTVILIGNFAYSDVVGTQTKVIRSQQLNQLLLDYNKRFVNGKYVSDRKQIQDFNLKQDALATELKKSGNLKPVLFITNDFDDKLTVNLFAFIDENNNFIGFFYDKSNYYDEEERSYIRFSTIDMLTKGLNFVPVNGTHALVVKGHYFTPAQGGTLQFNFLKDLNAGSWGALNVFLLNRNQGWGLFNLQYQPVSRASVKTWSSVFPPNGGVSDIVIQ